MLIHYFSQRWYLICRNFHIYLSHFLLIPCCLTVDSSIIRCTVYILYTLSYCHVDIFLDAILIYLLVQYWYITYLTFSTVNICRNFDSYLSYGGYLICHKIYIYCLHCWTCGTVNIIFVILLIPFLLHCWYLICCTVDSLVFALLIAYSLHCW